VSEGGLYRPELSRAFEDYFGRRGGATPNVPNEIVPVVIMDDNTKGPYVGCRHWVYGFFRVALAGNFSFAGVENTDPLSSGGEFSACVVDRILVEAINFGAAVGVDYIMGNVFQSGFVLADGPVRDVITDKELAFTTGDPQFGNVKGGVSAALASPVNTWVPGGPAGTVTRLDGPWVLGPGQSLIISPTIVNCGILAHFRGRYYPSI
jgi:hypothetical protein